MSNRSEWLVRPRTHRIVICALMLSEHWWHERDYPKTGLAGLSEKLSDDKTYPATEALAKRCFATD